jgi:hypothetical protein
MKTHNHTLARHLQSVLRDPALYAAIMDLDNQSISDLSRDLRAALTVAHNVVFVRTHQESQS